jgi:hypothetical protein
MRGQEKSKENPLLNRVQAATALRNFTNAPRRDHTFAKTNNSGNLQ